MRKLPTGILGLDGLIMGGLPEGSLSLVLGPPGSGKSILSKQYIYEGLVKERQIVLVDTCESFNMVVDTMRSFGWAPELLNRIVYLDCYSWKAGEQASTYGADLRSLSSVSIAISKVLEDQRIGAVEYPRLVIDSFSDFIMSAGTKPSLSFLEGVKTRLLARKVTSLILLEEGLHEDKVVAALEFITDGTIKMKYDEKGRFLMVSRMKATPTTQKWVPFTIAKGVEVLITQYFR